MVQPATEGDGARPGWAKQPPPSPRLSILGRGMHDEVGATRTTKTRRAPLYNTEMPRRGAELFQNGGRNWIADVCRLPRRRSRREGDAGRTTRQGDVCPRRHDGVDGSRADTWWCRRAGGRAGEPAEQSWRLRRIPFSLWALAPDDEFSCFNETHRSGFPSFPARGGGGSFRTMTRRSYCDVDMVAFPGMRAGERALPVLVLDGRANRRWGAGAGRLHGRCFEALHPAWFGMVLELWSCLPPEVGAGIR